MGTQLPKTCTEVEINILRSSVHLVGFISNRLLVKNAHTNNVKPNSWLSECAFFN